MSARRGHQRERDLVNLLRDQDWIALRAPASLGVAAVMAGGTAWLVWWPPRAKPRWIPADEWP